MMGCNILYKEKCDRIDFFPCFALARVVELRLCT